MPLRGRLCWAISVLMLAPGGASAGTLPKFDVDALCRAVSNVAGQRSDAVYAVCVANEQRAMTEAARLAPKVAAEAARQCEAASRAGGGGSYVVLQGCMAMARLRQSVK